MKQQSLRIISGGQTGVDRAALDAALQAGVPCGGWCPEGRLAEDGVIPAKYPLIELEGGGYAERTKKNVINSDGTVIIYFGDINGGTELTRQICVSMARPLLLIDATKTDVDTAVQMLTEFITLNDVNTFNIAGPRASKDDRAYHDTFNIMYEFLNTYE